MRVHPTCTIVALLAAGAFGQSTQPTPPQSRPAPTAPASDAVDRPLTDTERRQYMAELAEARRREIPGAMVLRQELRVALNSASQRSRTRDASTGSGTPASAAPVAPTFEPPANPGTAVPFGAPVAPPAGAVGSSSPGAAARAATETRNGPSTLVQGRPSVGRTPPARLTQLTREQSAIAQQLGQVEAMQRLYTAALEAQVHDRFEQAAKAEAARAAALRERRRIRIGPEMSAWERLLPIQRVALQEYEKLGIRETPATAPTSR